MGEWEDAVVVGVVARAHGNRAEVIVNPETDFPEERFRVGAQLLGRRQGEVQVVCEVTTMRMHLGRPVIGLAGVTSMNEAEALAGLELLAPPGEAAPLPRGQYYHRDLIGCVVVTEAGEAVGRVTAVEGERGASRLIVGGGRMEVLIPLADEICEVDVPGRRIVVRPPAGLLELNGDWR